VADIACRDGRQPGGRASFIASVDREGWDVRASRLDHPFLLTSWLGSWFSVFAPAAQPVAKMWHTQHGAPLFSGRTPRVVRAGVNVHTPLSGSLSGADLRLGAELSEAAMRLVWPQLPEAEALVLAAELRRAGWLTRVEHQHTSPVVETADSHRAYVRQLGRNVRQRAARLERKLAREEGARLVISEPRLDPRGLERALALEAAGWKGRRGTAILSDPLTATFYRRLAQQANAQLFALEARSGLLAFSLCLRHRERLFLLKTGYNERYANASPGLVVQFATIRHCHELELAAYDLLGAADPWKLQLATNGRRVSRLVADRPCMLGYAHQRLRVVRPAAKAARAQILRFGGRDRR
jgi:CelD/BcsL family acetyltransferase involved in cellulose biosynthesis